MLALAPPALALLSYLLTRFGCPAYRFRIGMGMNSPDGCRGGLMAERPLRTLRYSLVCPARKCKGAVEFSPSTRRAVPGCLDMTSGWDSIFQQNVTGQQGCSGGGDLTAVFGTVELIPDGKFRRENRRYVEQARARGLNATAHTAVSNSKFGTPHRPRAVFARRLCSCLSKKLSYI